jgi:hypothetical protein
MMNTKLSRTRKSSSKPKAERKPQPRPQPKAGETSVYGSCDADTLAAIDRVADQMLMPRSWVVCQILREWAERRSTEINALESSWNGSYREELGRLNIDAA